MAKHTGLFQRNGTYYLRFIIPSRQRHLFEGRSRIVKSLGTESAREAKLQALVLRAQWLSPTFPSHPLRADNSIAQAAEGCTIKELLAQWQETKRPSKDTYRACELAVEELLSMLQLVDINLSNLTRKVGQQYSAYLIEQCKSRKTAHGKLTWVKSLLNFAYDDLELLVRNPWRGIDIQYSRATTRRIWTDAEVTNLLDALRSIPKERLPKQAGSDAAYWLPFLAIYTGARLSELAQLKPSDLVEKPDGYWLNITDNAPDQKLKTVAAKRSIPVHQVLVAGGLVSYAQQLVNAQASSMWPALPTRTEKAGGYFSNWFGRYLKAQDCMDLDFHSFRHTFRTKLVMAHVPESVIDRIMGHSVAGSVGKSRYTHIESELRQSINVIKF